MERIEDPYPPPEDALRWVLVSLGGGRIASVRALPGGAWHANHAVDVLDTNGRLRRLVLRRWARPGWELADPDFTAEREAAILPLLSETAVPSPRLVAADPAGAECDVPALLITRLPGRPPGHRTSVEAYVDQVAGVLPHIHAVDGRASTTVPGYRRYHHPEHVILPAWLTPSPVWERAVEVVARQPPTGPTCFIHRDFHLGNTLWSRGRLTGVVDWTQGSWGPPSVDLGHMRWNLAAGHGPEAPTRFLDAYQAQPTNMFEHDPYWDVVTLVDLLADVAPASPLPRLEIGRLEQYLAGVLAEL